MQVLTSQGAVLGQNALHLSTSPLLLLDHAALPAVSPTLWAEHPVPSSDALEGPGPKRCHILCCHLGNLPLTFLCHVEEFNNNPQVNIKMLPVHN